MMNPNQKGASDKSIIGGLCYWDVKTAIADARDERVECPEYSSNQGALDRIREAAHKSEVEKARILRDLEAREQVLDGLREKAVTPDACRQYLYQFPKGGDPEIEKRLAKQVSKARFRRIAIVATLVVGLLLVGAAVRAGWLVRSARLASGHMNWQRVIDADSALGGIFGVFTLSEGEVAELRQHAEYHLAALQRTNLVDCLRHAASVRPQGLCAHFEALAHQWKRVTNAEGRGDFNAAVEAAVGILKNSSTDFRDVREKLESLREREALLRGLRTDVTNCNWLEMETAIEFILKDPILSRHASEDLARAQECLSGYMRARHALAAKTYPGFGRLPDLREDLKQVERLPFETATNRLEQAMMALSGCQCHREEGQLKELLVKLFTTECERLIARTKKALPTADFSQASSSVRTAELLVEGINKERTGDSPSTKQLSRLTMEVQFSRLLVRAREALKASKLDEADKHALEAGKELEKQPGPELTNLLTSVQNEIQCSRQLVRAQDALKKRSLDEAEASVARVGELIRDEFGPELRRSLKVVQQETQFYRLLEQVKQALAQDEIDMASNRLDEASKSIEGLSNPLLRQELKRAGTERDYWQLIVQADSLLSLTTIDRVNKLASRIQELIGPSPDLKLQERLAVLQSTIRSYLHFSQLAESIGQAVDGGKVNEAEMFLEDAEGLSSAVSDSDAQALLTRLQDEVEASKLMSQAVDLLTPDSVDEVAQLVEQARGLISSDPRGRLRQRLSLLHADIECCRAIGQAKQSLGLGNLATARLLLSHAKMCAKDIGSAKRAQEIAALERVYLNNQSWQELVKKMGEELNAKSFLELDRTMAEYKAEFASSTQYSHQVYTNCLLAHAHYQEFLRARTEAEAAVGSRDYKLAATRFEKAIEALSQIPIDFGKEAKSLGSELASCRKKLHTQRKETFEQTLNELENKISVGQTSSFYRDHEERLGKLAKEFSDVLDAERGCKKDFNKVLSKLNSYFRDGGDKKDD